MNFKNWLEAFEPKVLYIVRGLPKSGRSTKANELLTKKGGSLDHIFNTKETSIENGKGLLAGHKRTFQAFKYAIDNGITPIILDGDHYNWGSIANYVKYAEKAEYEIKLEEPNWKTWEKHRKSLKNKDEQQPKELINDLKGVSKAKILAAIKKWQEINLKEKLS